MKIYEGNPCSICEQELKFDDDVVVCPYCGTPYHRDCYDKEGACRHSAEHGTFEWTSAVKHILVVDPSDKAVFAKAGFNRNDKNNAVTGSTQAGLKCPSCGTDCTEESVFCTTCGKPIHEKAQAAAKPELMPAMPIMNTSTLKNSDTFDDITVKDWTVYIGQNAPYYLMNFKKQDERGHKIGFTLSAALFAPYYFLYRKVWGIAIFSTILLFIFNIPSALVMLENVGYPLPAGLTIKELSEIASWTATITMVIRFLFGFFAVAIYRSHSAKVIKKWQKNAPSHEAYQSKLKSKAGPSRAVLYVIMGIGLFMMVSTRFLGL